MDDLSNAVERVARFMWEQDWGPSYVDFNWDDSLSTEKDAYLGAAELWIAAFPQLALEGREEWNYGNPSRTRTVWATDWSEVQS